MNYVNFRNLQDGNIKVFPKLNLFFGKNGQGKTSFLEALYFGATGNEAADQMVMQVLEEYCAVNGYEVVAVISENARPEGMTFPMKFAFVGMAEVEDVDVVVTLMSDMVGDCEETIMDNIIMLGEHGITVETANDDMAGYYQKMEQAGKKEDNGIVSLADFMAVFFRRLRADR